MLPNSAL